MIVFQSIRELYYDEFCTILYNKTKFDMTFFKENLRFMSKFGTVTKNNKIVIKNPEIAYFGFNENIQIKSLIQWKQF